jgi:acyl-CoA synthetase (AMP-forming)/AMP-acid ligase II
MNLALGKGSLIIPKWEKKIISSLNNLPMEYRPDTIATGPHFLNLLHQHVNGKNLNLNTIKLGGALSNINQIEAINQKFTPLRFIHVYGSTEAEPVAFCDMHESLKLSKEREYFQCLYLGKAISEIKTINKETLWVAGPHVSAFYLEDEISNQKNKMKDDNLVYHNMGDRIEIDSNQSLWYQGRDFQTQDDFLLEQKIYNELESSEGFITNIQDEKILVTSVNNKKLLTDLIKKYNLDKFKLVKKIYKDRRHLSRIDRHKTLLKNKMNIKEIK